MSALNRICASIETILVYAYTYKWSDEVTILYYVWLISKIVSDNDFFQVSNHIFLNIKVKEAEEVTMEYCKINVQPNRAFGKVLGPFCIYT